MTLEDIEAARQLQRAYNRIDREIRELRRNPLPSKVRSVKINGKSIYTTGGGSSLPSSPVEKQVAEILRLEEEKYRIETELAAFRVWQRSLPDQEIREIINWRVFQLKTWEQIARIIMRSESEATPRMRLRRFFERSECQ